jgi:hypothetical protein
MKKGTTPQIALLRPATALALVLPEKAATMGVNAKFAVLLTVVTLTKFESASPVAGVFVVGSVYAE